VEEGVTVLQLTDDIASLIDGPRTPGYTCKLALSQRQAKAHPDAELFIPGSYRWDRFLEIVHHKAKLCYQYVVEIPGFLKADPTVEPEPELGQLSYEPHLLSHWRLSYRTGHVTQRRVIDLVVNLITGHLEVGYYRNLLRCLVAEQPLPFIPKAKRRLRFRAAYELMTDRISALLMQEDSTWAQTACSQLKLEKQAMEQYYADRLTDETAKDFIILERDRRIQELQQRSQPRVLASPFASALIYIPMISYQAFFGKKTLLLRFDPLTGQVVY